MKSPVSPSKILTLTKTPAFLVTNLVNILYLTGVRVSAGVVLVVKGKILLFVDSRYSEIASSTAYTGIIVRSIGDFSSIIRSIRKCAFEASDVTVARLERWKKQYKNTKFVQTLDLLEGFRREKKDYEINKILAACSRTKKVLKRIPSILKIGISEGSLAHTIEEISRKFGGEGMAFETIVAFGEHSSRPHHRPTDRKLMPNDIVQIDIGVKCQGYCSDFSRVYFVSPPDSQKKKALRALKEAVSFCSKISKPGLSVRVLDIVARKILRKHGFTDTDFCHALGHGVGLDIHEGVTISSKTKREVRLKKNEVITIEPGLYFPGKWGMRWEDTIVVK